MFGELLNMPITPLKMKPRWKTLSLINYLDPPLARSLTELQLAAFLAQFLA